MMWDQTEDGPMEIISGIHWITGINCNCYLVISDKQLYLIDTGMPRNTKKIMAYISDTLHRRPTDLKMIILTHSHADHTGNAQEIKRITGAKIASLREEADYIAGRKRLPPPTGFLGVVFKLLYPFIKVKPFKVDTLLDDGDTVAGLRVLHTPGHTPGSIALYDPARKVLFSGDMLTYRKGTVKGPPDKFIWDLELTRRSIEMLKSLDFDVLMGGHGEILRKNASKKVRKVKI
jgi:hydroxyacylglutathione hydrolase